jgi:hypothetical protein
MHTSIGVNGNGEKRERSVGRGRWRRVSAAAAGGFGGVHDDAASGDFAEGGHVLFVFGADEGIGAFFEFADAFYAKHDEGKTVFDAFETIFNGNSGHVRNPLSIDSPGECWVWKPEL